MERRNKLKIIIFVLIFLEIIIILFIVFFVYNRLNESSHCDNNINPKVLLIGIDGADWHYMYPLLKKGKLPNIKSLMQTGSYGKLSTISKKPTGTANMQWTTMITGKSYKEHNITSASIYLNNSYIGPVKSGMRTSKALWNILGDENISVGVVGWPTTWPAENINGYMVSNYLKYRSSKLKKKEKPQLTFTGTIYSNPYLNQTFPEKFYFDIESIIKEKEKINDSEINKHFSRLSKENNREIFYDIKWNYVSNEIFSDISLFLLKNFSLDFITVIEYGIDVAFHRDYAVDNLLSDYYVYVDEKIGELLEYISKDTNIVIVSEHGHYGEKDHVKMPIDGIFIIEGPCIKNNFFVENVSILDIFPTILFIFDLSIPNDINGRILQQVFNDEFFEGKLSKNINSYEDNISKTLLNMNFLLFDDEIIKRLESIGYLV